MEKLDDKMKELIAIGASYAVNCKPCMEYHRKMAERAGADKEEMLAAIAVGEKVRNGAHSKSKAFVREIFGEPVCDACCAEGEACA
jgi:AhpD family alkylhydroperoxidase